MFTFFSPLETLSNLDSHVALSRRVGKIVQWVANWMESIFAPRETVSRSDNTQISLAGGPPAEPNKWRGASGALRINWNERESRKMGHRAGVCKTARPPHQLVSRSFGASGGRSTAETYRSESKVVRYQQQHDVTDRCRGRRARVPRRTHHRRGRMLTRPLAPCSAYWHGFATASGGLWCGFVTQWLLAAALFVCFSQLEHHQISDFCGRVLWGIQLEWLELVGCYAVAKRDPVQQSDRSCQPKKSIFGHVDKIIAKNDTLKYYIFSLPILYEKLNTCKQIHQGHVRARYLLLPFKYIKDILRSPCELRDEEKLLCATHARFV